MIGEGSGLPTITQILDRAENNRHVSSHSLTDWFSLFQEVVVSHDGIMTPGSIQGNLEDLAIPVLLVNYAFSYFIAAVDTCLSGQVSPCFALQRMCIESAVYAHAIMRTPELGTVWVLRDTSPEDKQAFGSRFKIGPLMDALPDTGPAPREVIRSLYNRTISYGGHPNPGGALSVGGIDETDQTVLVGVELFSQGRPLLHALKGAADVGYAMVCLEDLMFSVQLAPAGLPERIVALSTAGLQRVIADSKRRTQQPRP